MALNSTLSAAFLLDADLNDLFANHKKKHRAFPLGTCFH